MPLNEQYEAVPKVPQHCRWMEDEGLTGMQAEGTSTGLGWPETNFGLLSTLQGAVGSPLEASLRRTSMLGVVSKSEGALIRSQRRCLRRRPEAPSGVLELCRRD